MAQTQVRGTQVLDGSVQRSDLDVATAGQAVIRKVIAGSNVTITSTGADAGTGDVTINATAANTFPAVTSETAPAANFIKLYGKKLSVNHDLTQLAIISPNMDNILETSFNNDCIINWLGFASALIVTTGPAPTALGTATAATETTANAYTQTRKIEYLITVAATTAVVGLRTGIYYATIGGVTANKGGFTFEMIAGPGTGVATATNRFYMGVASSVTAPTDVEPSNIANSVSFGWDAADGNAQIMHRGTGAVTKIDLGAAFAVPTVDRTTMYKLILFSPHGVTQSVRYEVTNLQTGAVAFGTITTNLPTTTTNLAPRTYFSVGGTSSVIGIGFSKLYFKFATE
jgi:hypothetical protein